VIAVIATHPERVGNIVKQPGRGVQDEGDEYDLDSGIKCLFQGARCIIYAKKENYQHTRHIQYQAGPPFGLLDPRVGKVHDTVFGSTEVVNVLGDDCDGHEVGLAIVEPVQTGDQKLLIGLFIQRCVPVRFNYHTV
jgi:hypothetical protein